MGNKLDNIAKEISDLAGMPNDDSYFEACILVAEDLYELNHNEAYEVAEIIQDKYLKYVIG